MTPSGHPRLRSATADDHRRLDALFGRIELSTIEGYRRFLVAHALALPAVERELDAAGFSAQWPEWPQGRRWPLLQADLRDLGIEPPPPLPFRLRATVQTGWGCAYVLEGSRLGGRLLAQRLPPGLPSRYLTCEHPSMTWLQFLRCLESAIGGCAEVDDAVVAAVATFGLFESAGHAVLRERGT